MRSSPNALAIAGIIGASLLGCGNDVSIDDDTADVTEQRSALTNYRQAMSIPAYLSPGDPGWTQIMNAGSGVVQEVIANGPSNGPPAPAPNVDPAFYNQFQAVRGTGIKVLGYVNFFYGRDAGLISADVNTWIHDYQVDGIFFDNAGRLTSQNDIARWEYYVQYVNTSFPTNQFARRPYALFNIGTVGSNIADYVRCTYYWNGAVPGPKSKYVTGEMTHDVYVATSTDDLYNANTWINNYSPSLFVQIPYKNPDPATWGSWDVNTIMGKPQLRNAAWFYVQDFTGANTWGTLTSQATWDAMVQKIINQGWIEFNSTQTAADGTGCPSPAP